MSESSDKIALALMPDKPEFDQLKLMVCLCECFGNELWREYQDFAEDLAKAAPQVLRVSPEKREQLVSSISELGVEAREVSQEEANRIIMENKPKRGTIDLHIRTRDWQINEQMIDELTSQNLISGYRYEGNADNIYYWKDDRWYQDFKLKVFNSSDIPQIEEIIGKYCYILVDEEEQP